MILDHSMIKRLLGKLGLCAKHIIKSFFLGRLLGKLGLCGKHIIKSLKIRRVACEASGTKAPCPPGG